MFVCPTGHMAIRKARQGKKNQDINQAMVYFFDIDKCRVCSRRKGCYKEDAKSKSCSVRIKSDEHRQQSDLEKTELFKTKVRSRYKTEAKTRNLKMYLGMTGQTYTA